MDNKEPRLSIGLPVYNGDQYLEVTLRSLLAQTYQDYKLIISDNASTDRTEEICRTYVSQDKRIHYFRNERNIGATQNWYKVFELSSSEYFASAADDDRYDPDYMRKCIDVLDKDPSVILCFSKTKVIDAEGNIVGNFELVSDTTSKHPHERLYNVIVDDYLCIQLYAVMRSSALRNTKTFVGYNACDRNTLFELALLGVLYEIPEYLFYHRLYQEALGVAMNSGKTLDELFILDPGMNWRYRSTFLTVYGNYFASIARLITSPSERFRCYRQLIKLIFQKTMKRAGNLMSRK